MGRELDAYVTDHAAFLSWLQTGDPWARVGAPTDEARLQRLFDLFLPHAMAVLENAPRTPEMVRVTTLPMPSLHAMSNTVKGRDVIALHEGLVAFNYAFLRGLAVLTTWPHSPAKTSNPDQVSQWLARLLDQACSPRTTAVVARWPAEKSQIQWAEQVATIGECFILAHELAHLAWGERLGGDAPEEVRPFIAEFEADIIALEAVERFVRPIANKPGVGLLATELIFRSMHLIDLFKGTHQASASHPPPLIRIENLREWIEQNQPGTNWRRTLAGRYQLIVENLTPKIYQIAAHERTQTRIAIERLLVHYTVGPNLNLELTAFRSAAFELLDISADATLTTLVSVLQADLPPQSDVGWVRAMQRRVLAFETLHHLDPRTKRALGLTMR